MEEQIIEAVARDGSVSAAGITLYAGSGRKLLIGCAGLLREHELLVRAENFQSPAPLSGRAVQGGKVAELLLDLSDVDGDMTVLVRFATNLGALDLVLAIRVLPLGAAITARKTYPLAQG